jgi:hypothetical protein
MALLIACNWAGVAAAIRLRLLLPLPRLLPLRAMLLHTFYRHANACFMIKSFKHLVWLAWLGSFTWTFAGHLFFLPTEWPLIKAAVLITYPLVAWAIAKRGMAFLRLVWRLLCLIDDSLPV